MGTHVRNVGVATIGLALAAIALAQPPTGAPAGEPGKDRPITIADLAPAQKLGLRVNLLERQATVIPTLVIVPDEASYVAAVAGWQTAATGAVRYPVLIDNGTWASRTRIARFARAFKPKAVMRWSASGDAARLPEDAGFRRLRIEASAAKAWGVEPAGLDAKWKELGFAPPGVVVASLKDPAWTAALALAAGRGEPIVWAELGYDGDPAGFMYPPAADAFNGEVMKGVEKLGRTWKGLGDDIDAVTLCMTTPSRVFLGDNDKRKFFAFTDWVGRASEADKRGRWAWCGQIMGDSARAAHDAMAAMFILPDRAWLLDGYPSTGDWDRFDMGAAARVLEKMGLTCIVDDAAGGAPTGDLRRRAAGLRQRDAKTSADAGMGVDAGLIAINTKGNAEFFTLADGDARPLDLPVLRRPAIAYIVHSFSLASPTSRGNVGGVLMERGAYAYLGSVEEPFLQAFVPTPVMMTRLAAGYPWGAAGRIDGGDIWKLAVLGDPLITFGPRGTRAEATAVPLPGALDLSTQLPEQLKSKDYLGAVWTLAMTERDRDACRLVVALAKDDGPACTPVVGAAAMPSAFFTGDYAAFLVAARAAAPALEDPAFVKREGLAEARDMVWQAVGPSAGKINGDEADLLADYLRPDMLGRDTSDATRAAELVRGMGAGRAVRDKSAAVERRHDATQRPRDRWGPPEPSRYTRPAPGAPVESSPSDAPPPPANAPAPVKP